MERSIRLYSESAARMSKYLKLTISLRLKSIYGRDLFDLVCSDIIFSPLPEDKLGLFNTSSRLILIAERLLGNGEETILSIALHETAHAICYYRSGSTEHDSTFREVCRSLGIGEGFEKARIDIRKQEGIIQKIRKLEALSSSPFEAEAQAAMAKARELAIKYHIEREKNDEERIWEADLATGRRISRKHKILASMVSLLSGVYVVTVHLDSFDGLRCYGQKGDVEIAVYLFDTLERTIDRKLAEERSRDSRLYQGQLGTTSFYMGVLSSLNERFRTSGSDEDTKAIIRMRGDSGRLARRLVFTNARLSGRRSMVRQNEAVYQSGRSFGSRMEIRKGVKRDDGRLLLPR